MHRFQQAACPARRVLFLSPRGARAMEEVTVKAIRRCRRSGKISASGLLRIPQNG